MEAGFVLQLMVGQQAIATVILVLQLIRLILLRRHIADLLSLYKCFYHILAKPISRPCLLQLNALVLRTIYSQLQLTTMLSIM
jgi:hypothetical protein